jgi:hypothetical protein
MGMSNQELKSRYWPEINDLETARKVAKQGVWAALFVAGVTAVFATLALFGKSFAGVDESAFVAVVIFGALAIGIWRMSRVAATLALVLFVVEKVWAAQDGQRPAGVILAIVITLIFVNTVRATFRFRRLSTVAPTSTGPDPIAPK